MRTLRFILGDHLTRDIATLRDANVARDVVLMAEVRAETDYVPHHRQKIAFILSAMRHFAEELRRDGLTVDYIRLDDADNPGSFAAALEGAILRHRPDRIVVTEPGEWRVLADMRTWAERFGIPVDIRDDDRFFCSRARFGLWASSRRSYRMEFFYRELRSETGLLMDGEEPAGGRWNFDHENRKALPKRFEAPFVRRFAPDTITREVVALVARTFPNNFGDLDTFSWGVTRADALLALDDAMHGRLARFGDYQDAMKQGEPFLFHSILSPYLNIGLLTAREVCAAAEGEYRAGRAPLNAAEGFVRQILGWREYVRGLYWRHMPDYASGNALDARRPLPWLYWSGETTMNCLAQAVGDIRRNAYGHHIQRLMVTGNFALLAGVEPRQVEEWYLAVYADAFEWVELPNTHGMALFADGGLLGSKPYAASGAYIDRMSDYCRDCTYDPKIKTGEGACPLNPLYWAFLIRNEKTLARNPRMAMPYRTLAAMTPQRRTTIVTEAEAFLDGLEATAIPES